MPDRITSCGLLSALSVIFSVPVRNPLAVGVKSTLISQEPPAATVPPFSHVVPDATIAKLLVVLTVPRFNTVLPVFVNFTVFAVLVVPTFCVEKLKLEALKLASGLMTSTVSGTVCGLPGPLAYRGKSIGNQ